MVKGPTPTLASRSALTITSIAQRCTVYSCSAFRSSAQSGRAGGFAETSARSTSYIALTTFACQSNDVAYRAERRPKEGRSGLVGSVRFAPFCIHRASSLMTSVIARRYLRAFRRRTPSRSLDPSDLANFLRADLVDRVSACS